MAVNCCCGCVGCCFPIVGGNLQSFPWQISAPNCPALNGQSGTFAPFNPIGNVIGACGTCICYSAAVIPINMTGGQWQDNGLGVCVVQSCGAHFCFSLSCDDNEAAVPGIGECCSRLRLKVWARNLRVTGGGATTQDTCTVGIIGDCLFDPVTAREIHAASCACGPPLTAAFDLSQLGFACLTDEVQTGVCAGKPLCCNIINCNLTGATLTI